MEINITAKMCLFSKDYFLNKYELGLFTISIIIMVFWKLPSFVSVEVSFLEAVTYFHHFYSSQGQNKPSDTYLMQGEMHMSAFLVTAYK